MMESTNGSSDDEIKTVLILGDNFPAPPIIHALSHSPQNYTLHIAHPHTPSTPHHQGTHFHTTKLTPSALTPLFHSLKPDLVINCTPSTTSSSTTHKDLIDCLLAAAVPRYIPCEFGHDALNFGIQERLPLYAERASGLAYLHDLSAAGKLSWSAVAVGTVLDRGLLSGNLGFDLAWRSATFHGPGDARFPASSSSWIGRVVCALLAHWEDEHEGVKVENQYLHLAETTTTPDAVLAALEAATGGAGSWSAGKGSEEDVAACVREAEKRIERGFPDAGMFLMERSLLYDRQVNAAGPFEKADEDGVLGRLGLEGKGLEEVVRGVVEEFQAKRKAAGEGCGCD